MKFSGEQLKFAGEKKSIHVVSVLLDQPLCLGEAVSPQSPCWGHVTLGRYDMEERVFRGGCFRPDRTEIEAATTAYRRFLIDY